MSVRRTHGPASQEIGQTNCRANCRAGQAATRVPSKRRAAAGKWASPLPCASTAQPPPALVRAHACALSFALGPGARPLSHTCTQCTCDCPGLRVYTEVSGIAACCTLPESKQQGNTGGEQTTTPTTTGKARMTGYCREPAAKPALQPAHAPRPWPLLSQLPLRHGRSACHGPRCATA